MSSPLSSPEVCVLLGEVEVEYEDSPAELREEVGG